MKKINKIMKIININERFLIIMQSFSAQCNSFYFHCFLAMDVL